MEFLSTPSARRATSRLPSTSKPRIFLSTPSARRATAARIAAYKGWVFLSTPSARRATWSLWMRWNHPQNFYPRPPRGGRPLPRWLHLWRGGNFYPRPPRGGRPKDGGIVVGTVTFLSTPSARRATGLPVREAQRRPISIHALREEGDGFGGDFEPRAG